VAWKFIGHTAATDFLEKMIHGDRLSNAYLVSGQKQSGKMTLALDFAAAVNCKGNQPPCNTCEQCTRVYSGVHTDMQVVSLGKVSNIRSIGIDDIRDSISQAYLMPFEGNYRFIIIEDAHALTREASNALLKILEEPPPRLIIVLLVFDVSTILPTIISRCQHIQLAPLSVKVVSESLVNRWGATKEFANSIAQISSGCIGKAVDLFSDPSIIEARNRRSGTLTQLMDSKIFERFEYAAGLASSDNIEIHEVLDLWLILWKNTLVFRSIGNSIDDIDAFFYNSMDRFGFSDQQILVIVKEIFNTKELINLNVDTRLALEQLMLSFPLTVKGV
jgi:DNA polymerase-3 subunit delta'